MNTHRVQGYPIGAGKSLLAVGELAGFVEREYGLSQVRCELIKATIRDTYLVRSDGGLNVLSVYRHRRRTVEEIAAELDFIEYLAGNGMLVAPAVRGVDGERIRALLVPEGVRYAVMFEYVEGEQVRRAADAPTADAYGRALSRLHSLADGEALPASIPASRPALDFESIVEEPIRDFAALLRRREDVEQYLREVAGNLRPVFERLPGERPYFGLIHGDAIPSNAIVTPSGGLALLDFDFCGPGWRAYDVALYLSELRFWSAPEESASAFLRGYQEGRELSEVEVRALPHLEAAHNIHALGLPAANVNEWGRSYLSDQLVDRLVECIQECMERAEARPFGL